MLQLININGLRHLWVIFIILLIGSSCTPDNSGSDKSVAVNPRVQTIDTSNCFNPEDMERLSSSLMKVENMIKQNLELPSGNFILELLPKDDEIYFISELQKSYCEGYILSDLEDSLCPEQISIYVECFRDNIDEDGNFEEFMSIFVFRKSNGVISFDHATAAG